jgi:hypothetical protein
MAWLAAVASLVGSALSSSAQSNSASKAAGAAAVPKPEPQGFTPTANAFAAPGQKQGAGADLSTMFSKSALPDIPQGKSVADEYRIADALGKTQFSSDATPPPIGSTAAPPAAATGFGAARPTIGESEASLPAGGTSTTASGGSGDWLQNAQTYAQLGALAQNALRGPKTPGGGIPQAAPATYTPTAAAAMARLQQLMAMRRGY